MFVVLSWSMFLLAFGSFVGMIYFGQKYYQARKDVVDRGNAVTKWENRLIELRIAILQAATRLNVNDDKVIYSTNQNDRIKRARFEQEGWTELLNKVIQAAIAEGYTKK